MDFDVAFWNYCQQTKLNARLNQMLIYLNRVESEVFIVCGD